MWKNISDFVGSVLVPDLQGDYQFVNSGQDMGICVCCGNFSVELDETANDTVKIICNACALLAEDEPTDLDAVFAETLCSGNNILTSTPDERTGQQSDVSQCYPSMAFIATTSSRTSDYYSDFSPQYDAEYATSPTKHTDSNFADDDGVYSDTEDVEEDNAVCQQELIEPGASDESNQSHDTINTKESPCEGSQVVSTVTAESDETLYCCCKRPSYGDMIACDAKKCPIEWYHFNCVGVVQAPKGKWICPDCIKNKKKYCKRVQK